jgi:energy-coupling factor transporter ATP-binding protein EcfA2
VRTDPILELRGVSKQYPGHLAVDGISLAVPRGAFYALLGPSGCGKTTTLRLIAGFEQPSGGDILLAGARINDLNRSASAARTLESRSASCNPSGVDEGAAAWAIRRQRTPGRPIRAADVVAEPKSRAKNARAWRFIRLCLGASGVPGHLVVGILKPLDELLDPYVVGQDLAGDGQLASEDAVQYRVEEDHRPATELAVRAAGLEEQDGRHGKAAQLDLASGLLHEIVALLFRATR